MAFIQVLDFRSNDIDTVMKSHQDWLAATEGKRTIRREIIARDRNDPSHYVVLAFFDSYESAMENSALPETQESAAEMGAATQDMTFLDLDIIDEA
jgi:hypothetical protein